MVTMMTESRQGARMRAAVDRLHAAQLAALAAPAGPVAAGGAGAGPGAGPGKDPAARRDAYGAEREVLAHLAEMGSLLVRLGGAAQVDAESAEMRRRVVTLAVACANDLAELVSLAFEVESAGEGPGEAGAAREAGAGSGGGLAGAAPAAATAAAEGGGDGGAGRAGRKGLAGGGSNGASAPARAITSMRAVTDANRLLVDQLKRLMQNAARRESWRTARPGELWRGLLLQVAALLPLVAELEAGALSAAEEKELARQAADAANYIAFLRFYPRLPTV
jgi:hypothetical protein